MIETTQTQDRYPRVLAIEDNENILEVFRTMLGGPPPGARDEALSALKDLMSSGAASFPQSQFRLDTAKQGEQGFELAKEAVAKNDPYAVIFIDIRMPPGWHGVKTAKEIRQVDSQVNIILNSAFSDFSTCQIVETVGSTDRLFFVRKPFHYDAIIQFADTLALRWIEERKTQAKLESFRNREKELLKRIAELENKE